MWGLLLFISSLGYLGLYHLPVIFTLCKNEVLCNFPKFILCKLTHVCAE